MQFSHEYNFKNYTAHSGVGSPGHLHHIWVNHGIYTILYLLLYLFFYTIFIATAEKSMALLVFAMPNGERMY